MAENKKQGQSMLNGAFVLVVATVLVKVIGALYKIPLTGLIGEVGRGYFNAAYEIYTPLYAISMAGLPVAVSKTVSQERALGHYRDVKIINDGYYRNRFAFCNSLSLFEICYKGSRKLYQHNGDSSLNFLLLLYVILQRLL